MVSLAILAAVGWVGSLYLRGEIEQAAVAAAEDRARSLAEVGLVPVTRAADFRDGFDAELLAEVDDLLRDGALGEDVRRVKVYGADGRILYSDEKDLVGERFEPSDELRAALAGRVASALEVPDDAENAHERELGTVLEVYVPVRADSGEVVGAFELYLAYAPVAERVESAVREVLTVLGVGLVVLYVALFRLLISASRRLRRQAGELQHQARHDALTGLVNRQSFLDELARGGDDRWAVLALDIDGFKAVNDAAGHQTGDRVLQSVAARLRSCSRAAGDVVARLGGDEFALLLRDLGEADAAAVAGRVLDEVRTPIDVDGSRFFLEASLGIAAGGPGADPSAVLRDADVAALQAKANGKGRIEVFDTPMREALAERLRLEADLRRAVEQEQFVVRYQPIVDLPTGRAVGVEALVRWQHPELGLLGPDTFIELAERTGAIGELGHQVLRDATRQLARWRADGIAADAILSVNLSAHQLERPGLVDEVETLLREAGLPGSALVLELTESALAGRDDATLATLHGLRSLGVRLAVDDFGTGFSSLSYLQRLPLDILKVDRSFVSGFEDWTITEAIVGIARSLDLELVAEGVEETRQADRLIALGCEHAQGWLWAPALPPDEAGRLLDAQGASLAGT